MVFCCDAFNRMQSIAGEKGISFVARSDDMFHGFFLQARPIDRNAVIWHTKTASSTDELLRSGILGNNGKPLPVATMLALPLLHCPHCGCRLADIINEHKPEFKSLVALHARLWDS